MPVAMPDPAVPSYRDDPRFSPDADRASAMTDIDFGPENLLEVKMADPDSIGTAGDETGIAAEIIRKNLNRGSQEY